ncbi:MAG: ExeM/NucH family extracellular endonuclease, partial [Pseudomonadota bacterium]
VDSESQNLNSFTNKAPSFDSAGDGFGKFQVGVSPSIPFALLDDSTGVFTPDTLGIVETATDVEEFFGIVDTVNPNNPDGPATACWEFDITGFGALTFSLDLAAMGDFENDDEFSITYSIDGAPAQELFDIAVDEDGTQTYVMASGTEVILFDPVLVNGTALTNDFETFTTGISGRGSTLTIEVSATANGGSEALAMRNMIVDGIGGFTPTLPVISISADADIVAEGNSGATLVTFTVTRSGDLGAESTVTFDVGGSLADDEIGTVTPEGTITFAPGEAEATITVEVIGDTEIEPSDLLELTLLSAEGATLGTTEASTAIIDDDSLVTISTVQGSGAESTLQGLDVTVEAVVTYVAQNGFYLQEEDADSDGDDTTSEGLFVFTGGEPGVAVGDIVQVTGEVQEFEGSTQISADVFVVTGTAEELPTKATVTLPLISRDILEQYEGMQVQVVTEDGGPLVVTQNFNLDRWGEYNVSSENKIQPTQLFDAQDDPEKVAELADLNDRNDLMIDNGLNRDFQNPTEYEFIPANVGDNGNGFLDAGDTFSEEGPTFRLGTQIIEPIEGIMEFVDGTYKVLANKQIVIDESTNSGDRPDAPADVGGELKAASFNVLNYFSTIDVSGAGSGPNNLDPRGADNEAELIRQTDKLVNAILTIDADVLGLQEIENGGFGEGSAIGLLVEKLNEVAGEGTYDFIDPTADEGFIGTDAISTGIIYKPAVLKPVASDFLVFEEASAATTYDLAEPLNAVSDREVGDFQRSRPAVAATFEEIGTNEQFTVVSNHFKSKGDSNLEDVAIAAQAHVDGGGKTVTQEQIDALLADPNYDQGDGQGYWNKAREDAANELKDWFESGDYADGAVTDPDYLILGDLNAYAKEDPTQVFSDDPGYTDLIDVYIGQENAYSFVFDGERGSLDQALASNSFAAQVTGTTEWHINADEPDLLNYDNSFKDDRFYDDNQFGASDHDPVIVGFTLGDTLEFT